MSTEKKEKSAKQLAYEAQQADLSLYEKRVEGMSHRALLAELKRKSNQGYEGKGFSMHGFDFADLNVKKTRNRAGIGNAEAALCRIILENTKTSVQFEKGRYARKDQVGLGTLSHFLR
jgi:hypothetical protein